MKRSTLTRAAAPAALVLTLGLAACGASNESDTTDTASAGGDTAAAEIAGNISGIGASSQGAAMEAWKAGFESANPDATVDYDPQGSGAGREAITSGAAQFAGSDAYLDDEELAAAQETCGGDIVEFPNYVSPIAVIYNLPGVDELNLSPAVIAGIFDQKITSWDAPEIAADNPDATLPATAITPVNRADDSGTTQNFTEYLSAAAPEAWTYEPDGEWPVAGGEAAQGTSGVVGAVEAGEGAIGYADESQAGELGIANVKVGEEFVAPSAEAAAAVVEASTRVEGRGEYDFAYDIARDTTDSGTYPVVLVSYLIGCTTYEDAEQGALVKAFLGYVVSDEGQQVAADAAGSAPLSATLSEEAATAVEAINAG